MTYPRTPPVGGPHNPVRQRCAFHDSSIQTEMGVHSMEHGAVWITYRPDLPQEQVEALRRLAAGQTHVLVSPYPGLLAPVVASAWGRQLKLESAQDPRLVEFLRSFVRGPQTPEPGAPCAQTREPLAAAAARRPHAVGQQVQLRGQGGLGGIERDDAGLEMRAISP